jgi:hypothetical protein
LSQVLTASEGSLREGLLEGFPLGSYLLLIGYTSRLCRQGKARISPEVASILDRLGTSALGVGAADCSGCWPSHGCWAAISARNASDYGNSPGSAASTQSTMWPPGLSEPDHRIFPPHLSRHPNPIGLDLSWTRTREPSARADRAAHLPPGIISTVAHLGQARPTRRDFTLTKNSGSDYWKT